MTPRASCRRAGGIGIAILIAAAAVIRGAPGRAAHAAKVEGGLSSSSSSQSQLASPVPRPTLRVCADPNNLPFSNDRGEGFENKIATLLAQSLGAELHYTWWAQRRGFVRNTLKAGTCDVILGIPAQVDSHAVLATRPYYRSSYVFATVVGRPAIRSFDDPSLRRLRIGVPLVGDDGANPPPEAALAKRGIIDNVVGYPVYGDYARPEPTLELLEALGRGQVDVAVVWGPLAGFFARRHRVALTIRPVVGSGQEDEFAFDIAMGVRPGDQTLRQQLDRVLQQQRRNIERILRDYGIPRV